MTAAKLECFLLVQDLVFSVKLQFGKTLVSVQNKFALQKDVSYDFIFPILFINTEHDSKTKTR